MKASFKLTILGCGTSTGVPVPGCSCPVCLSDEPKNKRDRTSALISYPSGKNVLIDASPDLRQQAIRFRIPTVDAVLFTHSHADHILGIEDLRGFNFVQQKPIPCYATSVTIKEIAQVFHYIFNPDPNYQGGLVANLEFNHFKVGTTIDLFGLEIETFELMHGNKQVVGFKLGNVAYATDCNLIPADSAKLLKGIDCLVLDALRFDDHSTHFTIPQAVQISQELGVRRTILTHTTHSIDYHEVSEKLPEGIELAYDGLVIEFRASSE